MSQHKRIGCKHKVALRCSNKLSMPGPLREFFVSPCCGEMEIYSDERKRDFGNLVRVSSSIEVEMEKSGCFKIYSLKCKYRFDFETSSNAFIGFSD